MSGRFRGSCVRRAGGKCIRMVGMDAMRRRTEKGLSILDMRGSRSASDDTRTISGSVINVRRFHLT